MLIHLCARLPPSVLPQGPLSVNSSTLFVGSGVFTLWDCVCFFGGFFLLLFFWRPDGTQVASDPLRFFLLGATFCFRRPDGLAVTLPKQPCP